MASLLSSKDLTSWYDKINAVRAKPGINLTPLVKPDIKQNSKATSKTIMDLRASILAMKGNTYLQNVNFAAIEKHTINPQDIIMKALKTDFDTTINSMGAVCPNCLTSTYGTSSYITDYDCSQTYSTNSKSPTGYYTYSECNKWVCHTCSTNGQCSNYSESPNYNNGAYSYGGDSTSCKTYSHSNTTNNISYSEYCSQCSDSNNSADTVYSGSCITTSNSTCNNRNNSISNSTCRTNNTDTISCKTYSV